MISSVLVVIYVVITVHQAGDHKKAAKPRDGSAPRELPPHVDILSLCTPHAQVTQFIVSFCIRVLPLKTVFGTRRNRSVFLSTLAAYVALGKHLNSDNWNALLTI